MIDSYATSYYPTLPKEVERDGKRYVKREITARNVREGDLVVFVDGCGPEGTVSDWSLGMVWLADSLPSGKGRSYLAPWERRVLSIKDWRGTVRDFILAGYGETWRQAHTDKLTVYRLARGQ
jgi:hypothetical protein